LVDWNYLAGPVASSAELGAMRKLVAKAGQVDADYRELGALVLRYGVVGVAGALGDPRSFKGFAG
jgi:hypothetical protein